MNQKLFYLKIYFIVTTSFGASAFSSDEADLKTLIDLADSRDQIIKGDSIISLTLIFTYPPITVSDRHKFDHLVYNVIYQHYCELFILPVLQLSTWSNGLDEEKAKFLLKITTDEFLDIGWKLDKLGETTSGYKIRENIALDFGVEPEKVKIVLSEPDYCGECEKVCALVGYTYRRCEKSEDDKSFFCTAECIINKCPNDGQCTEEDNNSPSECLSSKIGLVGFDVEYPGFIFMSSIFFLAIGLLMLILKLMKSPTSSLIMKRDRFLYENQDQVSINVEF